MDQERELTVWEKGEIRASSWGDNDLERFYVGEECFLEIPALVKLSNKQSRESSNEKRQFILVSPPTT